MKSVFLLFCLHIAASFSNAQIYHLTVQNGYGSGQYTVGDTIHIWSEDWTFTKTFSHWSGETSFLQMPDEWLTRLVMPPQDVTVKSNLRDLLPGSDFTEEQLMGRDTMQQVFHYFPPGGAPKGVVWLFHGGAGSAEQWVSNILEGRLFVNYLMADTFAVIVTECEERTKETDIDGDGNIRWQYTGDTVTNVDVANTRAIRDTFINRGWMTNETPIVAHGYSNGGFFGTLVGSFLRWNSGIMHNAYGLPPVIENTTMPILFSMSEFDDSPYIGPEGNALAFNNYEYLIEKGNCAQFFMQKPTPVYPERFKRIPGVTAIKSIALFNELSSNGCLDADNFPMVKPDDITAMVIDNPQNWPVYISLTATQRSYFKEQIAVMGALHYFNNDFSAKDLKFIKQACGGSVATPPAGKKDLTIKIFPNPSHHFIILPENSKAVRIFNVEGKPVLEKTFLYENHLDVSGLPMGLYLVKVYADGYSHVVKMIKT
jgi:Secretion system C-terminal sorting domain